MAWNKIYMNNKKQLKQAATTIVYCPGSAVHCAKRCTPPHNNMSI